MTSEERSTYYREYYQRNKQVLNEKCKKYKAAHPEKVSAYYRNYYQANREKELLRARRNYLARKLRAIAALRSEIRRSYL